MMVISDSCKYPISTVKGIDSPFRLMPVKFLKAAIFMVISMLQ
jgi:hypothetical protein